MRVGGYIKLVLKVTAHFFYLFATCCFASRRDTSVFNYAGKAYFYESSNDTIPILRTTATFCLFYVPISILFRKKKNRPCDFVLQVYNFVTSNL